MTIITVIMAVLVGWVVLATTAAIVIAGLDVVFNFYRWVIKREPPPPRRTPFSPRRWDR